MQFAPRPTLRIGAHEKPRPMRNDAPPQLAAQAVAPVRARKLVPQHTRLQHRGFPTRRGWGVRISQRKGSRCQFGRKRYPNRADAQRAGPLTRSSGPSRIGTAAADTTPAQLHKVPAHDGAPGGKLGLKPCGSSQKPLSDTASGNPTDRRLIAPRQPVASRNRRPPATVPGHVQSHATARLRMESRICRPHRQARPRKARRDLQRPQTRGRRAGAGQDPPPATVRHCRK